MSIPEDPMSMQIEDIDRLLFIRITSMFLWLKVYEIARLGCSACQGQFDGLHLCEQPARLLVGEFFDNVWLGLTQCTNQIKCLQRDFLKSLYIEYGSGEASGRASHAKIIHHAYEWLQMEKTTIKLELYTAKFFIMTFWISRPNLNGHDTYTILAEGFTPHSLERGCESVEDCDVCRKAIKPAWKRLLRVIALDAAERGQSAFGGAKELVVSSDGATFLRLKLRKQCMTSSAQITSPEKDRTHRSSGCQQQMRRRANPSPLVYSSSELRRRADLDYRVQEFYNNFAARQKLALERQQARQAQREMVQKWFQSRARENDRFEPRRSDSYHGLGWKVEGDYPYAAHLLMDPRRCSSCCDYWQTVRNRVDTWFRYATPHYINLVDEILHPYKIGCRPFLFQKRPCWSVLQAVASDLVFYLGAPNLKDVIAHHEPARLLREAARAERWAQSHREQRIQARLRDWVQTGSFLEATAWAIKMRFDTDDSMVQALNSTVHTQLALDLDSRDKGLIPRLWVVSDPGVKSEGADWYGKVLMRHRELHFHEWSFYGFAGGAQRYQKARAANGIHEEIPTMPPFVGPVFGTFTATAAGEKVRELPEVHALEVPDTI